MDTFAARLNTIGSALGVSMALRKESSVICLEVSLWCKDPGDTPGDFLPQLSLTCLLQGCIRDGGEGVGGEGGPATRDGEVSDEATG